MRLAADASALVGELLRKRGQALLAHSALELFVADVPWDEAQHELARRLHAMAAQGRISPDAAAALLASCKAVVSAYVTLVPEPLYRAFEAAARKRIPRDPADWPTVAVALAFNAGIWTNDADFLGCGCPTWTTDTLLVELG